MFTNYYFFFAWKDWPRKCIPVQVIFLKQKLNIYGGDELIEMMYLKNLFLSIQMTWLENINLHWSNVTRKSQERKKILHLEFSQIPYRGFSLVFFPFAIVFERTVLKYDDLSLQFFSGSLMLLSGMLYNILHTKERVNYD